MIKRKKTRTVSIGDIKIGGRAPISVQTMTTTETSDVAKTVAQIKQAEKAGCEIIRMAIPDMKSAQAVAEIKKKTSIPLIADIHFDYRLALECVKQGIDKLRINPGNIGSPSRVTAVVDAAKESGIPIRIGVNMGSLEKGILAKHGRTARAMVNSALRHVKILERRGFKDIIVAMKASDVERTVEAHNLFAQKTNYPTHIGVTEAGTEFSGTIKSSIGIGSLLLNGIGDTLRVSLTAPITEEVRVGFEILQALGIRKRGVEVTSCPTCARTNIEVEKLAKQVEAKLQLIDKPLKIAVMGCVVNGPGEAAEADIGITGSKNQAVIFRKGKVIKKVAFKDALKHLLAEIDKIS